jgi:hypothetical protein
LVINGFIIDAHQSAMIPHTHKYADNKTKDNEKKEYNHRYAAHAWHGSQCTGCAQGAHNK